jgi:16S rRNA processing protein RimM
LEKKDCFQLGYIAKLHGFKGEVSLFLDVTNPSDYASLQKLFIEINDQLVPFFIEKMVLKVKGFAALKLEGVDSENDARIILRKKCYLPAEVLPELDDKTFYDHEIEGFTCVDVQFGEVGTIVQVIDLVANPLLQIDAKGKEVLIPLLKNLVEKVDRKNKILHIKSPEGLLAIYLG